jgi:hypothetical protein
MRTRPKSSLSRFGIYSTTAVFQRQENRSNLGTRPRIMAAPMLRSVVSEYIKRSLARTRVCKKGTELQFNKTCMVKKCLHALGSPSNHEVIVREGESSERGSHRGVLLN